MSGQILIYLLATVLLTATFLTDVQQPAKVPRIAVLISGSSPQSPRLGGNQVIVRLRGEE
jgi:hypothetical protein